MIRAVIADDSALLRSMLSDILTESKRIEVVGQARNGREAVKLVKELEPDILVLDCEMPIMDGLQTLKVIMEECPLPVFMFSSLTREGADVTVKALELGAIDFLLKPSGGTEKIREIASELVRKISMVVIKGRFKLMRRGRSEGAAKRVTRISRSNKKAIDSLPKKKVDMIAIGSSTGGVQAALKIVSKLSGPLPPIVWVQHMPPNFTKSFAERLDGAGALSVKEAEHGDVLKAGHCYIASGGKQMTVKKHAAGFKLCLEGTEKVQGHCPSCDVLFNSVAQVAKNKCLGIILTGMGSDGTDGLKAMKAAGAYVIGQDEESCVVYGMPKSANDAGVVDKEIDISDIADALMKVTAAD